MRLIFTFEDKIKVIIKQTKEELEKDFDQSYDDMYDCYLKNSYETPMDYHSGVGYVEGMERVLRVKEKGWV